MFGVTLRRMFDELLERRSQARRSGRARAEIENGKTHSIAGDHAAAVQAFQRALAANPRDAEAHFRLGLAWRDQQRLDTATACYRRAIDLRPGYIEAHNNLGSVLQLQGETGDALASYRRAVELKPDFAQPYLNLGRLYVSLNDHANAAATFQIAIERGIDTASFSHLLNALTGENPGRAPDAYSRNLFDDFAGDFDRRLVNDLGYRIPEILATRIKALQPRHDLRVLDLGCGTGLCGAHITEYCATLTGVDLSAAMLARARARNIYDTLAEAEVGTWLANAAADEFDVVLAADVFIYIGELQKIFAAVARSLVRGGLFAFSIELTTQSDFSLLTSGRYAQSREYIRRLCAQAQLIEVEAFGERLRGDIEGFIFVLRKP